jgi:hypothetical protein
MYYDVDSYPKLEQVMLQLLLHLARNDLCPEADAVVICFLARMWGWGILVKFDAYDNNNVKVSIK